MIQAIYKPLGMTPLQALEKYRASNPELRTAKITYAGRLDPMAEGVLILLVDESHTTREQIMSWGKEYECGMLLGIATDSGDILGIVEQIKPIPPTADLQSRLQNTVKQFTGSLLQSYPRYSSKVVNGKPLWQWSRLGQIDQITLPQHQVFIERIQVGDTWQVIGQALLRQIDQNINLVEGDFRQPDIINCWRHQLSQYHQNNFYGVNLRVVCSSGVYIRQLVTDLGLALSTPAMTTFIHRTRVGLFRINDCIPIRPKFACEI